ncbi:pilus assembly protein [Solilutibacter tolerans]|nr:PilC/PilY family type IV pilus protein [Lysobacter tolerans]
MHARNERPGLLAKIQSRLAVAMVGVVAVLGTAPASSVVELTQQPLNSSVLVPGNMVLVPSVEFPTVLSMANLSAYSTNTEAVGYFDPNKCYKYNYSDNEPDRYFYPVRANVAGRNCNLKDEWSGNYLNWVGTQTIDPFRSALTGGYRVKDEPNMTLLEKARHDRNQRGYFPLRTLGALDVAAATPATWTGMTTRIDGLGKKMYFGATTVGYDSPGYNNATNRLVDYNPAIHSLDLLQMVDVGGTPYLPTALIYSVSMRVKVCDASVGLETNCRAYGSNYKPEGLIQEYANRIRYSVFSYLNDHSMTRDGGVMRARAKYVGPNSHDPKDGITANIAREWDPATGVFVKNPDAADATATGFGVADSGVINYINKFGEVRTSKLLKDFDPVSEMYYAALRYLKGLGPVAAYSSGLDAEMTDGFPVISDWGQDPMQYRCQANVMLGIGDAYTHRDKNLPGTTSSTDEPTKPAEVTADTSIQVDQVLARIFRKEGISNTDAAALSKAQSGSFSGRNNSAYIAALAYDAHVNDIRPDDPAKKQTIGRQTVSTYWVDVLENQALEPVATNQYYLAAKYGGFAVPSGYDPNSVDALADSTWQSGRTLTVKGVTLSLPSNYFPAGDAAAMVNSLRGAFERIVGELEGSGGSLAANSTKLETGTAVYQAKFTAGFWDGDISAYDVNPVTGAIATTAKWSAAAQLPVWNSRKILVNADGAATPKPFLFSNLSASQVTALGSATVVDYLRGDRSNEGQNGIQLRPRRGLLGDIVNSQPVYAGAPNPNLYRNSTGKFNGADQYQAFALAQKNRTGMIYVGANDGMLHAFDAATGVEKFAFIPNASIQAGLKQYTQKGYVHRYFMDGELTIADVYNGSAWKTILVGSMGRGGRAIFAMDITDPTLPKFLWEKTATDIPALGNNLGKPIIAQVGNGDWRVLVGNGPNGNGGTAQLVMIGALSGTSTVISTGVSGDNGLTAVQAWDDNRDGVMNLIYAGDMLGNVWRFGAPATTTNQYPLSGGSVALLKLFSAGSSKPITAAPLVGADPMTGKTWVFFGTGRYLNTTDLTNKDVQTWYGLIDDGTQISSSTQLVQRSIETEFTSGNLVLRGTSAGTDTELVGKRGWYMDLVSPGTGGQKGERMVLPNQFKGYVLIGTSRTPNLDDPCLPGGQGYVMAINPFTGGRLENNFFDVNGDGKIDTNDSITASDGTKHSVTGVGFSTGVNNPTFTGDVMQLGFDDATRGAMKIGASTFHQRRVSWRELIRD